MRHQKIINNKILIINTVILTLFVLILDHLFIADHQNIFKTPSYEYIDENDVDNLEKELKREIKKQKKERQKNRMERKKYNDTTNNICNNSQCLTCERKSHNESLLEHGNINNTLNNCDVDEDCDQNEDNYGGFAAFNE